MKECLRFPAVYQTIQNVGGFFGARVKSIAEYLPLKAGDRVVDTSWGPRSKSSRATSIYRLRHRSVLSRLRAEKVQ
jgi:hypothetical protein